jgi:hypothetical protein
VGPAEARQSGRRRRAEDPRLSSCATGVPGLNDNLAPVASMVEDRAAVHRFDQRGSGRSTESARSLSAISSRISRRSGCIGGMSPGSLAVIRGAVGWPSFTRSHTPTGYQG